MSRTDRGAARPSKSIVALNQPVSSPNQTMDDILPSLVKTAREALSSAPAPCRLTAPSANIDAIAEQLSYESATSLISPSIAPFLTTPWKHPLHWELPPLVVLQDIFQPILIETIQRGYADRSTRCFCAIVLTAAQQHLRTLCTRLIMRDYPIDMADCLSIFDQILTPKGVMVFIRDCERTERLSGRVVLDIHIRELTFAEHISEFIEQLPRLGSGAYYGAELQLRMEAEEERRVHWRNSCVVRTVQQAWRTLFSRRRNKK